MSGNTIITDLPDALLSGIVASITDTRTRNCISLASRKFFSLERATRTSLTLRGNSRDLHLVPLGFRAVTNLDLSLISPWGSALLDAYSLVDPLLLAHRLGVSFPMVTSLTVYARSPFTLQLLLPQWPLLRHLKLIRWHQRPASMPVGEDFVHVFEHCETLTSIDLSSFYFWTEDLPPVLQAYPTASRSLTCLNILTVSLSDGFKSQEIQVIASSCPNLIKLYVACLFDTSYVGFVEDETLLTIASGCPKLSVLHLVDVSAFQNARVDEDDEQSHGGHASIGIPTLMDFFTGLPLLEELVLDVCKCVRHSSSALELLSSKCPRLKLLKLGHFHEICTAVDSKLDGIALCAGLLSLSIKKSADLTDMGLIEIGRGCCKLAKFEIEGCGNITVKGMKTMVCLLSETLLEIKISSCKNLNTLLSLRALDPIRDRLERLCVDCVWGDPSLSGDDNGEDCVHERKKKKKKRLRYSLDLDDEFSNRCWNRLQCLTLWLDADEVLTPLTASGLQNCPNLEEIRLQVEGDCRGKHKPGPTAAFGLGCLSCYPRLSKMQLNCGGTIGFAFTAPAGRMDLSLWERFFLKGIGSLNLTDLHYWPPHDRDVNQRSLSLPGAGLLAECRSLRKLFIHGTAYEHFMMFLIQNPNLRDVQLREDYYPASENEMSSELRADSCSRFEDAINNRSIPD